MNILQLTAHFPPNVGGVETHLNDLVAALAKRKHNVFVLTYRPLTTKASWRIYEKQKRLTILRIPWLPGFFYKLAGNPAGEFLYLLPGLFLVTPITLLIKKIHVIHTHGLVAGFVGVFWGKVFGKKIIITTHSIYHFPQKGLYASFVRWIFFNAHAVLCLSQQSKNEVVALGVSERKVQVFTYWINQKLFHTIPDAKKRLKLKDRFVILFVGRLVEEKGLLPLLQSAKNWNPALSLVIAGTGPLETIVGKQADGKKILYVGKISQRNLPLYYSAADVLIVPSIHEEGFGRVLLESLSCGTPVIAARRGGIIEAIDEKVGYLVDITPENITKVVEYCCNHRVELENKSREAQKFAKQRYSEKNIETILSAYK